MNKLYITKEYNSFWVTNSQPEMLNGDILPHIGEPVCMLAEADDGAYGVLNKALTKDDVADNKHIFELKIREITNDNYIHRLKYEIEELKERISKLKNYLDKLQIESNGKGLTQSQLLLSPQIIAMEMYRDVLVKRLLLEEQ